jgi:predicted RNase H-like HicB family nuclease
MDYQIFVEQQAHNGYVARTMGWPDCVATGHTKQEAVVNVQAAVAERLASGEVLQVRNNVPVTEAQNDPWEALIGSCVDDPYWDEFQAELRRIREEANRA